MKLFEKRLHDELEPVISGVGTRSLRLDVTQGDSGNPYDDPKTPPQAKLDGATAHDDCAAWNISANM